MKTGVKLLLTVAITFLGVGLFIVPSIFDRTYAGDTQIWATAPEDSFKYGYISTNVDCREGGPSKRMKFLSQTFSYCYGERPSSQIISDNKIFLHQVIKSSCGENYSVTYQYLYGPNDTFDEAEEHREKELTESGYTKHVEWHASVDYPSSTCR